VYGPVCTVVWEGRSREASPYPDLLVVELRGPTMFARIGVMQALNRGQIREFTPSSKGHHWGQRKLKRDQP
jgi:hypothetical protein